MYWKPILFCGLFCFPCFLLGQDTLVLEGLETVVVEAKGKSSIGTHIENWNKEALAPYATGTVADVVERESGIFVKSYGNGVLATTSMRGGSAGHTAIVWNGVSLQSPMLGQLDFSLLPVSFVDEMSVEYGGNTSLWGSGAIGGVIHLNNKMPHEKGISGKLFSEIGSFGLWNQSFQFKFKTDKFAGKTSFFHKQVKNNFTYQIREDLPIKEQSNAAINANGLLQELYWEVKPRHQLSLLAWLQESDREIPPTTTQRQSQASQEDDFLRTTLRYKWVGEKLCVKVSTAYFNELLNYRDDYIRLVSNSRYTIWTSEASVERYWGKQRLMLGLHNTVSKAHSDGYANSPREIRTAAYALFSGEIIQNLNYQLSARQQVVDKKTIPPTASFSLQAEPLKWLSLHGKVTRNYRLPTFNDRYWKPGGDTELKPEIGWSEEASLGLKPYDKKEQQLNFSITAFNRNINDWILWSVNEGESYYSANNITKVWSRGLEHRVNYKQTLKKTQIQFSAGYDFIRSTNQIALERPKIEAGQQLIYTPIHQGFSSLGFTWKGLEGSYQHRFTGTVQGQNVLELDGYHIGYFKTNYKLTYKQFQGRLFFHLDNIWNTDYRVLERRPMPGRSFRLGVNLQVSR